MRKIVIVGGGATGWMAAAYLQRFHPECSLTLIESPDDPPLGVGESLNAISRRFNHALGLDEREFLRAVDGTFKTGIDFHHFNHQGGRFFHPFGKPDQAHAASPGADALYRTMHLCRENRFDPHLQAHGYHVCATRYGAYLRGIATARGVRHVRKRVEAIERTADRIRSVEGFEADLFIDCTGFRSLLLGNTLNIEYLPAGDRLDNDSAVAVRLPYNGRSRALPPYTRCTALEAGWVWEIPLWSRLGAGYCFSSRHLDYEAAQDRLLAHLGVSSSDDVEVMRVPFRHGRHKRAHAGNCVALGNAFGFIEPLESTGISLTQANIMLLAARLDDLDTWNDICCRRYDTTVDFIFVHYRLSGRRDTAYWRDVQNKPLSPALQAILENSGKADYGSIEQDPGHFYRPRNWDIILSGMGHFGSGHSGPQDAASAGIPSHLTYLEEHIHNGQVPDS